MASALERRFDIARSALGRRAQEQSLAEQEAYHASLLPKAP